MTRLPKLTALLAGLILVTFALGGSFIRPADADEWVALMSEANANGFTMRYCQVWPGVDSPLYYDLAPGSQLLGIDSTGRHAYFSTLHPSLTSLNYYQADSRVRPIVENAYAETVFPSPDFTWLIYGADDPDGGWDYYVTNIHTGQRWNLSDLVRARSVVYRSRPQFSADGTWLYLTVQERDLTRYEIIGIHLPSGAVVDITHGHGTMGWTRLQALVGDWLVFDRGDNVLYRIRTDGSDFGVLLELPPQTEVTHPFYTQATYPAFNLLLVQYDRTLYALDVAAAELLWQQLDFYILDVPASPTGWMTVSYQGYITRLHLPTGELRPMPHATDPYFVFLGDAPDFESTFFEMFNRATRRTEWQQYWWATGESRQLPVEVTYLAYPTVSPDGVWLWVVDSQRMAWRRIRIRDGYTETVMPLDTYYAIVGWMRPNVQSWHPLPLLLIALALVLIGIFPRRLLKLPHRSAS